MLKAAPKLRAVGHPIGIGMSNEIDSNMALMAMMMCFGSFIQNENQRVVLNSQGDRPTSLKFATQLYEQGMSNEIFAWTASSNNQAMVAGRLSMAMNAISITRTAELTNPELAAKIGLMPIPRGPHGRFGLEHVMGAYVIWKFARNKAMAKKFLVDLETKYIGAFENSKFYNFPSWPASVTNIPTRVARDPAKPTGKYKVLAEIAEKYTLNPGWPGQHERGHRRALQQVHDPADVRRGRPGQTDGRGRGQDLRPLLQADLPEVAQPREDLACAPR